MNKDEALWHDFLRAQDNAPNLDMPFLESLARIQKKCLEIAQAHGFVNPPDRHVLLMHSELAELTEAIRGPAGQASEHIPNFTAEEEECADLLIRLLHYCETFGIRLGAATLAKMEFNETRPYKHGGKRF